MVTIQCCYLGENNVWDNSLLSGVQLMWNADVRLYLENMHPPWLDSPGLSAVDLVTNRLFYPHFVAVYVYYTLITGDGTELHCIIIRPHTPFCVNWNLFFLIGWEVFFLFFKLHSHTVQCQCLHSEYYVVTELTMRCTGDILLCTVYVFFVLLLSISLYWFKKKK